MAVLHDSAGNPINSLKPADLLQQAHPTANTGGTITLPAAGVGLFHYITAIRLVRTATAALAGTAELAITTTNLNGLALNVGNAMVAGGTQNDMVTDFAPNPVKSQVANTPTTIVLPAPGAAVRWDCQVFYFAAA